MSKFDSLSPTLPQTAQVQPAPPAVHRDTPARAPSIRADVVVPFLWALITSLITSIGLYVAGNDFDLAVAWFGLSLLSIWLAGLYVVIRSLYAHERPAVVPPAVTQAPAEQAHEGTIVINGARGRMAQRSAEREDKLLRFRAFLLACEGGHTDVRYWQEQRDAAGKRFITESDYRRYRGALMQSGDAAWIDGNNHAAGWYLTRPAEAIYQDTDYWYGYDDE
jgi:hypothetical protein